MQDTIYHQALPELDFSGSRVMVVGDVMLDRYWQGGTERISPEAPVPVIKVDDQSVRVGGAGNVAVNVTALGASARLLSITGKDADGDDLSGLLESSGVINHCIQDKRVATTTKLRVLSQHQQLIRLDFEHTLQDIDLGVLFDAYKSLLAEVNVVVLSDYGKGVLSDPQAFIQLAGDHRVKVLVDPKYKDFMMYQGAYLITPNKKEFEAFAGACHTQSELEEKAVAVIDKCQLGGLLVTQGDNGMTLIMQGQTPVHFPASAQDVFDVTGAGDTVIAAVATALSSGMTVQDATRLSSVAAGIVVGRVGTAVVTLDDIHQSAQLAGGQFSQKKISSQDELLAFVETARLQNKKVVMTNGCFDLLHSGHVEYLEQAAQLGDILIVAVNSDLSVKQLKGEGRPINSLAQRMSVLAGLASVTRVVAFSGETPENLICRIKPDVLVKGGDYRVEQIAGRDCAGEVRLISLVDGCSTSNTIEKILSNA